MSQMVSGSCSGLLLRLLITLLAVEGSGASGYQENTGTKRKLLRGSKIGKAGSSYTVAFDGATATTAYANGRKILGGRKMMEGMDEKPLYVSAGKNRPADLEKSFPEPETERDHIDAQDKAEMFKHKANHIPEESGVPSRVDKHQHSQNRLSDNSLDPNATPASSGEEKAVAKYVHYSANKNDGLKTFLEGADEVANLMHKDYRGWNRRRPPIHNQGPND